MACNHKFQGHKNGVTCLLCGLRMTPKEYAKYLTPSTPEEPESALGAPETPSDEPQAEPQGTQKSVTRKPRANRKKKEDDTNG